MRSTLGFVGIHQLFVFVAVMVVRSASDTFSNHTTITRHVLLLLNCSQTLQETDTYVLRMADDDWDPDLDFPGLDSSAVITDVGVDQFVLCQQVGAFLGRVYDSVQWWVAAFGTTRLSLTGIGFLVWIGFFPAFPPYPFKTPFLRETQKHPKCDVENTTRWPVSRHREYSLRQNLRYRLRYSDLPRAKFEGLVINLLRGLLLTR